MYLVSDRSYYNCCDKCKHTHIIALLRDVLLALARFVYQVKDEEGEEEEVSEAVIYK